MENTIISIDPGKTSGGIAIISNSGIIAIPVPYDGKGKDKIMNTRAITDIFKQYKPYAIFIEHVHSMPGQGIASTAKFMYEFGVIVGLARAYMHRDQPIDRVYLIAPQTWKRIILGPGKHDKADSIVAALRYVHESTLIPAGRRVPSDGLAEAILIGLAGLKKYNINIGVSYDGKEV